MPTDTSHIRSMDIRGKDSYLSGDVELWILSTVEMNTSEMAKCQGC